MMSVPPPAAEPTMMRTGFAGKPCDIAPVDTRSAATASGFSLTSFTAPLRRALVQERIHAFPKIPAHVAHENEVLALLARQALLQAPQRFFRRAQRQGRIARDQPAELARPALQLRRVFHDLVQQTELEGFVGIQQPRGENEVLYARRTDERRQPAETGHGQAVAERPRDRKSEPRRPRRNPQIAAGRDRRTAAGTRAGDGCNGRNAASLERGEDPIDLRFVVERVLRRLEGAKLIDVRARGKRLVALAGQNQGPERPVGVGGVADFLEALVHRKGERVSRLGSIEGYAADSIVHLVQKVVSGGRVPSDGFRVGHTVPFQSSPMILPYFWPSVARTARKALRVYSLILRA